MLDWDNGDISTGKLVQNCCASFWCSICTTLLYWFNSLPTVLSPTENSIIPGLFKALSNFPVLFKADLIFKDFSRKPSKFKYFSCLCEPCELNNIQGGWISMGGLGLDITNPQ